MTASSLVFTVGNSDTAAVLGSGDVPALATPRLLAWCEAASVAAAAEVLQPGETSVGIRVKLEHLVAVPVGGQVTTTATLLSRQERLLTFSVEATDNAQRLVATGEVRRVAVDRERFMERLQPS